MSFEETKQILYQIKILAWTLNIIGPWGLACHAHGVVMIFLSFHGWVFLMILLSSMVPDHPDDEGEVVQDC